MNRPWNILFAVPFDPSNKGDASILNSMLSSLGNEFPEAKFMVFIAESKICSEKYMAHNVEFIEYMISWQGIHLFIWTILATLRCILWTVFHRILRSNLEKLGGDHFKALKAYNEADVILFPSRDLIATTYGGISFFFEVLLSIFIGVALRKPTMIYASQIGPFENNLTMRAFMTKLFLNMVNLITVRDKTSREYLRKIGVTKPPIYVTADPAFLLQPISSEKAKELLSKDNSILPRPLIGVNTSGLIHEYGFPETRSTKEKIEKYVKLMSRLIDHLVEKYGATVVLVPHVFTLSDDRTMAAKIYSSACHREKITLIKEEMQPEELRGIIGLFDMFITTRHHPLVHSISMHIPTIAIGYTFKMKELMKELDCEKWVCDIRIVNINELISKVDDLWLNREKVSKILGFKIKEVRDRSMLNVKLVQSLLYDEYFQRWILKGENMKEFSEHPLLRKYDFCVGCGGCEGVCMQNAIELKLDLRDCIFKPVIDFDSCTWCMRCVKVCPIVNKASMEIMNGPIGPYVKSFVGFSRNCEIRKNGASGGVVTALLLFMLSRNFVDRVIISKIDRRGRTNSFITNSEEAILSAQGSIYFQTFTGRLIKEVLKGNDKRYAIVGLPCQIDAFKRSQSMFASFPTEKCIYLGLVCNHINVLWYLDYVIRHHFKKKYEDIIEISHRKGGWPGGITLKTLHNSIYIPSDQFWGGFPSLNFCTPLGCFFCANHMNALADISLGDAWLPQIMEKDKVGTSIIIPRTKRGLEVLTNAQKENVIELAEVSAKKLLESQPITEKMLRASVCRSIFLRHFILGSIRIYGFISTLLCVLPFLVSFASRNLLIRRIMLNFPRSLVLKFGFMYRLIWEVAIKRNLRGRFCFL